MIEFPPPLKKGMPLGWRTWLNQLLAASKQAMPLRTEDIETHQTDDGTALFFAQTSGGGAAGSASATPFQVITRAKPNTTPVSWQFAVRPGALQLTGTPNKLATITGITPGTNLALNGFPTVPGTIPWVDWNGSKDVVYIDAESVALGSFPGTETYTIRSLSQGGSFDPTLAAYASAHAYASGSTDPDLSWVTDQDELVIPLAYITPATSGGAPIVTQQVFTNLQIILRIVDGSPTLVCGAASG